MKSSPQNMSANALSRVRKSKMEKGLSLLLEAHECAKESHQDCVQFSVEIAQLVNADLSLSAIRWLLLHGYLRHCVETPNETASARIIEKSPSLSVFETSCFSLTDDGVCLAIAATSHPTNSGNERDSNGQLQKLVPQWRADTRELYFEGHLVKKFRVPAENQITVLQGFEAQNWPARIENPLCTDLDGEATERLHDAIKRLNQRQQNPLVRFHGDGTGKGVMWDSALDRP